MPYIGKYSHFNEVYNGEKGLLDLDYWVMTYNKDKAVKQFADVTRMLRPLNTGLAPIRFMKMDTSWWKRRTWAWNTKAPLLMATDTRMVTGAVIYRQPAGA